MPFSLDSYLGVHQQALRVDAKRAELLASNLANADTPNYKAQDLDFKAALAASGNSTLAMTDAGGAVQGQTQANHIALNSMSSESAATKYRVPLAPSLDGNTVDAQVEQANFAENSIRYQATLTFLNGKFRALVTAITGQ